MKLQIHTLPSIHCQEEQRHVLLLELFLVLLDPHLLRRNRPEPQSNEAISGTRQS
jgi:hypothetical protein